MAKRNFDNKQATKALKRDAQRTINALTQLNVSITLSDETKVEPWLKSLFDHYAVPEEFRVVLTKAITRQAYLFNPQRPILTNIDSICRKYRKAWESSVCTGYVLFGYLENSGFCYKNSSDTIKAVIGLKKRFFSRENAEQNTSDDSDSHSTAIKRIGMFLLQAREHLGVHYCEQCQSNIEMPPLKLLAGIDLFRADNPSRDPASMITLDYYDPDGAEWSIEIGAWHCGGILMAAEDSGVPAGLLTRFIKHNGIQAMMPLNNVIKNLQKPERMVRFLGSKRGMLESVTEDHFLHDFVQAWKEAGSPRNIELFLKTGGTIESYQAYLDEQQKPVRKPTPKVVVEDLPPVAVHEIPEPLPQWKVPDGEIESLRYSLGADLVLEDRDPDIKMVSIILVDGLMGAGKQSVYHERQAVPKAQLMSVCSDVFGGARKTTKRITQTIGWLQQHGVLVPGSAGKTFHLGPSKSVTAKGQLLIECFIHLLEAE